MSQTSREVTLYNNGVKINLEKKEIIATRKEDAVTLTFLFEDGQPQIPACTHHCKDDKIRVTQLMISEEAMISLCQSYLEFKKYDK